MKLLSIIGISNNVLVYHFLKIFVAELLNSFELLGQSGWKIVNFKSRE